MDPQRVNNLFNLGLFNIKLGLDNIRDLLNRLGNPHQHPRIIHLAGTNGKGSTLVALEKLLVDSGYSTGSTISPHLIKFNERFRINGKTIDDSVLEFAYLSVCEACNVHPDLSENALKSAVVRPTFFEFSIAMAFVLFREYAVDYILLETGLGGRLDATNVVENPIVNILTRIALDHQTVLGDTVELIAAEKLGIIKPGALVFSALQEKTVIDLIRGTCAEKRNTLFYCPEYFSFSDSTFEQFAVFNLSKLARERRLTEYDSPISIPSSGLIGEHQKENLLTALASYICIAPEEKRLSIDEIIQSLADLRWEGRLQYMSGQRHILLDVAHNVSGAKTLANYLNTKHSKEKILFAVGWTQHHELVSAFKELPIDKAIFLPVHMANERSVSGSEVYNSLKDNELPTHPPMTIEILVNNCRTDKLPSHDLLVVAGSLYLVGEFLAEWEGIAVQR